MLVVYLHECHAIPEWTERMNGKRKVKTKKDLIDTQKENITDFK